MAIRPIKSASSADNGPEREQHLPRQGAARWSTDENESNNSVDSLLEHTARGDEEAFARLYDLVSGRVYGLALRLLRSPAHAEEVAQEALVEVWRKAARFDSSRGSAMTWILTLTHRRAVDRIRSTQAASDREQRVTAGQSHVEYDEVVEEVTGRLERQAVRHCLRGLTPLQREAITLAYYQGYTYREVAQLLSARLPTIKSRMRDGLIRLRDCLGAT